MFSEKIILLTSDFLIDPNGSEQHISRINISFFEISANYVKQTSNMNSSVF